MPRHVAVFALGATIAAALCSGCLPKARPTQANPRPSPTMDVKTSPTTAKAEKKAYTRDEFKKLVMGKTQDEVLKAVGKPVHTAENGIGVFWYFDGKSFDPITGKADKFVSVVFVDGVVESVSF